jgi:hypothetical protein
MPTRRQLLAAAVAGPAAMTAVPGGPLAAPTAPKTDAEILQGVLRVEVLLAFAYAETLRSSVLTPGAARLVREILTHERAHVETITRAVRAAGGTPVQAPPDARTADRQLAAVRVSGRLERLRSEADALRLLVALERVAEGAYFRAIGELASASLLRTAAEIMSSEAQHAALLRQRLEHGDVSKAVPGPFVQGA